MSALFGFGGTIVTTSAFTEACEGKETGAVCQGWIAHLPRDLDNTQLKRGVGSNEM